MHTANADIAKGVKYVRTIDGEKETITVEVI